MSNILLEELRNLVSHARSIEVVSDSFTGNRKLKVDGHIIPIQWTAEFEEIVESYHRTKLSIIQSLAEKIEKELIKAKAEGLKPKYIIHKADGTPVDDSAEYFVLRLDKNGEPNHVHACLAALAVYTNEIRYFLPQLAKELEEKYDLNRVPIFNTLSPRLTA